MSVLNPFLYNRLLQKFGKVSIACQGEPLVGTVTSLRGREEFIVSSSGEYYRVNCPFCNDTKQHLWINHRWGTGIPGLINDKLNWMLVCYRRNCFSSDNPSGSIYRRQLSTEIYGNTKVHQLPRIPLGTAVAESSLEEIQLPNACIPVNQLESTHQALLYIKSRNFDPNFLAEEYGLQYCASDKVEDQRIKGRLIIPITADNKLIGWQARAIDKNDPGPKYYNAKNVKIHKTIYNYDNAKHYPFVVVTEGVTDVWTIQEGAVSLLGKTLNDSQLHYFVNNCSPKGNWKVAIVALDPDAEKESDLCYMKLKKYMPTLKLKLPNSADPADMGYTDFWSLTDSTCLKQGVDLCKL